MSTNGDKIDKHCDIVCIVYVIDARKTKDMNVNCFMLQLTDGRKTVGGKLEVKLRIRDPFKSKQVEEVKEKWLVIDQFIKTLDNPRSKGVSSGEIRILIIMLNNISKK